MPLENLIVIYLYEFNKKSISLENNRKAVKYVIRYKDEFFQSKNLQLVQAKNKEICINEIFCLSLCFIESHVLPKTGVITF